MNKTINKTELFIEKAIKIHGPIYDYSKVIYINTNTKIIIICKIHNEFEQLPSNHLQKNKCPKCHGNNKLSTFEFINKAKETHGNSLYNYSKVIYLNIDSKVIIICKIHGEFEQSPYHHIHRKQGCRYCGIEKRQISQKMTHNNFIIKANEIHNNKYDYSKINYINNRTKITIICKIHGEFDQLPKNHLKDHGCIKCRNNILSNKFKSSISDFINRSNKIHNSKYNYSDVKYINANTNVNIICNIHGKFHQRPMVHLLGSGCSKCSNGIKFSKCQIKWLEFLEKYYNINIQHMGNSNQEYRIKNTKWKADGYCKETNTIFEYHGDFWHGNPKIYKPDDMNNVSKRTMGTLYKRTINREQKIKELGYNLIIMWESDWNKINKSISILQKKFRTCKDLNLLASLV